MVADAKRESENDENRKERTSGQASGCDPDFGEQSIHESSFPLFGS
jgi:hypothetical protein